MSLCPVCALASGRDLCWDLRRHEPRRTAADSSGFDSDVYLLGRGAALACVVLPALLLLGHDAKLTKAIRGREVGASPYLGLRCPSPPALAAPHQLLVESFWGGKNHLLSTYYEPGPLDTGRQPYFPGEETETPSPSDLPMSPSGRQGQDVNADLTPAPCSFHCATLPRAHQDAFQF